MAKFSALRRAAALSLNDVAALLGTSNSTVCRWEHGAVAADESALSRLRMLVEPRLPLIDFRFIDLFAGIGGLRRGFDAIGGRCVFTSEWDRFAERTYRANFRNGPEHRFEGDVTKGDTAFISDHDGLLAGLPPALRAASKRIPMPSPCARRKRLALHRWSRSGLQAQCAVGAAANTRGAQRRSGPYSGPPVPQEGVRVTPGP